MALSPTNQLLDTLPDVEKFTYLLKLLVDSDVCDKLTPSESNSWYGLLYDCSDALSLSVAEMRKFAESIR